MSTYTQWTEYKSNSYLVMAHNLNDGIEVTNMHTGFSRFLQGDDAAILRDDLESVANNYDTDEDVTKWSDSVLSQYFD